MLTWIKNLFTAAPLNPPVLLRSLDGAHAIPRHNLTVLPHGECMIESRGNEAIALFEIEPAKLKPGILSLRTELRSQNLIGSASLELTCYSFDRRSQVREFRYRENPRSSEWNFVELTQSLPDGQRPNLIRLCLLTEGPGTIWIRKTKALVTPY